MHFAQIFRSYYYIILLLLYYWAGYAKYILDILSIYRSKFFYHRYICIFIVLYNLIFLLEKDIEYIIFKFVSIILHIFSNPYIYYIYKNFHNFCIPVFLCHCL